MESADIIADENNESAATVRRYIKLTYLIPYLLELVDDRRIAFRPAVELSYLSEENQYIILNICEFDEKTPSLSQAIRMKKLEKEGNLNEETIESIMKKEKPNQKEKFSIKYEELRKYFPMNYSNEKIKKIIFRLLESYSKKQKDKINGVFM